MVAIADREVPEVSPTAAVVGGGPAGLMAAEVLAGGAIPVTVYDRMPTVGRKLLMAGRGGLNLTHGEPLDAFLGRYRGGDARLAAAVRDWPPEALRAWCRDLGQDTFVGSSGRVFPTAMKASPLLRAWRARLEASGVRFAARHRWTGWDATGRLTFVTPDGPMCATPDAAVLALGGASWSRLGSDGAWATMLADTGTALAPFAPANCGFMAPWSPTFLTRHEGTPLKAVGLAFAGQTTRGDVVVTRGGLEGGALYGLSAPLRDALARGEAVYLRVALRPDMTEAHILARLGQRRPKDSTSTWLRRSLHLAPAAVGLLGERMGSGPPLSALDPAGIAARINNVPIRLTGPAPLDTAISTAGGLLFAELDDAWMLRRRPGLFAAGEMLDWEAPTGGYLLQACLATGRAAGLGALRWLQSDAVIPGSVGPAPPVRPG
jgi:uncharacterized flavoprotein (TIGR03862 family)